MSLPKPYFEDKDTTIYHARNEDILPHLGRFDLLLTDPPYGINGAAHQGKSENGWRDYGRQKWDLSPASLETLLRSISMCKTAIIWGGNYFSLPPSMGWLVWNKMQREFSLADGELAWTNQNRAMRIFD